MATVIGFYVSARSGRRAGMLLGPFPSPEDAQRCIDLGRELAARVDRDADSFEYGTAVQTRPSLRALRPGLLNSLAARSGVDLDLIAS